MKLVQSRIGILIVAAAGLLGVVASSASAGTVLVNPGTGTLRQSGTPVLAASASVALHAARADAVFAQSESGSMVQDFATSLAADSRGSRYQFTLSYVAGEGYALDFTPILSGFTRVGDASDAPSVSVSRFDGFADDIELPAQPRGRAAAKGSFNFLRLRASSLDASSSLQFGDLSFETALTSAGSLNNGSILSSGLGRASIDGSTSRGSYFQDIVSDTDLSQHDWHLTGTLTSSAGLSGASFDIDLFDSSFQTLQVIPLPTGAGLVLAGMVLGGLRRRR